MGDVRARNSATIKIGPPLRVVDAPVEAPFLENFGISRVDQAGAQELELSDQSRVLNETLIVLSPCSRQFPRRVDGGNTDRVPAPTKSGSPLARQWQI